MPDFVIPLLSVYRGKYDQSESQNLPPREVKCSKLKIEFQAALRNPLTNISSRLKGLHWTSRKERGYFRRSTHVNRHS
jgi:hypothetical protein